MGMRRFFSTPIYSATLLRGRAGDLNARLLRECLQLREDDVAGRAWSKRRYPGGFTSYGSAHRMHTLSPTFGELQRRLDRHVHAFTGELDFDLEGRRLSMTDCWVNLMGPGAVHGLHLHPLATISGTYYVRTPRGSSVLKFEDPRIDRMMAAPPRRADCRPENRGWIEVPAEAGRLVLFESWLRHEVPPNPTGRKRVSISFNYGWF